MPDIFSSGQPPFEREEERRLFESLHPREPQRPQLIIVDAVEERRVPESQRRADIEHYVATLRIRTDDGQYHTRRYAMRIDRSPGMENPPRDAKLIVEGMMGMNRDGNEVIAPGRPVQFYLPLGGTPRELFQSQSPEFQDLLQNFYRRIRHERGEAIDIDIYHRMRAITDGAGAARDSISEALAGLQPYLDGLRPRRNPFRGEPAETTPVELPDAAPVTPLAPPRNPWRDEGR